MLKFLQASITVLFLLAVTEIGARESLYAESHNISAAFECSSQLPEKAYSTTLQRVQSAYNESKNFTADFIQDSKLAALDSSEQSSGTMSFQKPSLMRWDYTIPTAQQFLVRDKTVWFYQPADQQVVIDEFSKVIVSDLPVSFLLGIGNISKEFSINKLCETKSGLLLDLSPREVTKAVGGDQKDTRHSDQVELFSLLVSANEYLPKGAIVTDIGGNTTTILFTNIKRNVPSLAVDFFSPKFPEGIDVSDRRITLRQGSSDESEINIIK